MLVTAGDWWGSCRVGREGDEEGGGDEEEEGVGGAEAEAETERTPLLGVGIGGLGGD